MRTTWIAALGWLAGAGLVAQGRSTAAELPEAVSAEAFGFREIRRERCGGGVATALAFSPDGRLLALGGRFGEVQVFDVSAPATPRRVAGFDAAPRAIEQLAFAGAGGRLVVLAGDLSVWSGTSGELERRAPVRTDDARSSCFAVSPGGGYLAFVSPSGDVIVARIQDGRVLAARAAGWRPIVALAFSPDERRLGIAAVGAPVLAWDWAVAADAVEVVGDRAAQPVGLCFLPDGTPVVADAAQVVRIGAVVLPAAAPLVAVAASRLGATIAVQMRDRALVVFERGGTARRTLFAEPDEGWISVEVPPGEPVFALGPRGRTVALGGRDGRVRLVRDGRLVATLDGLAASARYLAFTREGTFVIAAHRAATSVIPLEADAPRVDISGGGPVAHSDRAGGFAQFVGERFRFVDAASGREAGTPGRELHGYLPGGAGFLAAAPDGTRFALSGDVSSRLPIILDQGQHAAWLVDARTGDWELLAPGESFVDVGWTRDGRAMIASFGATGLRRDGDGGPDETDNMAPRSWRNNHSWIHSVDWSVSGTAHFLADPLQLHAIDAAGKDAPVDARVRWFRCLDEDVALSHDGAALRRWDLADLRPQLRLRATDEIVAAAVSLDRRRVAIAGRREVVVLERVR